MAGTDHGEVLTNLEEIFGTVVEHEVIKMVLQSCGWDSTNASDMLLAMIDKDDLPDYALDLLDAESDAPGSLRRSCSELQDFSLKANGASNCDKMGKVDGSPRVTLGGVDSESSSPSCSPLRSAALSENAEVSREHDSSQWVLAPEFVPNAFYQNSSSNSNGIWPLGMSRSLVQAPQLSMRSKGEVKPVKVGKKDQIVSKILLHVKILVLMRGLPGSGKSTLAKEVKGRTGVILSADDYFHDKRGNYNYDPSKLGNAHQWNRHRTIQRLKEGKTPIIIDNTNIEVWEMKPYIKLALQFGYEVDILDPETPWKLNPKELAKRNIHGVPKSKIVEMKSRYNQGIKIEQIVADLQGFQLNEQNSEGNEVLGPGPESKEVWDKLPQENNHIATQQVISPLPRFEGSFRDDVFWSSDEDEEGADVIIEGYESEEDEADAVRSTNETAEDNINKTDLCGEIKMPHINEKSKDQDDIVEGATNKIDINKTESEDTACQEVFNFAEQENEREENENEGKSQTTEDQEEASNRKDTSEDTIEVQGTDVSEKEEIDILKEAFNDTDVAQIETDWDEFISQVSGEEEITDQKFNELVMSFECAMKEQLQKRIIGSNTGTETGMATSDNKETLDEDSIMYDLCNNMKEQTGKSLSVLTTGSMENEEPNSFLMIDQNQECQRVLINDNDTSSSPEAVSEVKINSCDGNTNIVEGMAGNQNASDNNQINLPDNNHVPSGSCVALVDEMIIPENSPMSPSKINDICSPDTDIQKEPHDVPSETGKDFAENENKICGEKILTPTDDTGFSNDDIPITLVDQDRNEHEMSSKMMVEDPPQDFSDQLVGDSLTSWECIDTTGGVSPLDWDSAGKEVSDSELHSSKPTRTRRKRTEGDPTKWLKDVDEKSDISEDPSIASWNPVQSGLPSWDTNESEVLPNTISQLKTEIKEKECNITIEPQPHTGAVRKFRRQKHHTQTHSTTSSSSGHSDDQMVPDNSNYFLPDSEMNLLNDDASTDVALIDAETQTRSVDFEALQQGNSLLEMKIIYGQPDYIPQDIGDTILPENGPLTMGKLRLDKGTMTDCTSDVTLVEPFRNLVAFFPKISEEDLQDVYEKCNYNLNWAMNVLLDGGYEMSDPIDANISYDEPREVDMDTESTVETTSTGDGRDERSSFADASDISSDMLIEERTRKFKQSQQRKDLDRKKALENSFNFPDSVDDRVTRLTGKDFGDLSMTKIKRMKNKKKHGGKKNASVESVKPAENKKADEDGGGAQYITLVMDPLFASQLNSMFGPVGSCEISGDLTVEDRSVILPLEFCHIIHKYWADTLDGKFKHETEVLDSLIREDESFARRLQEEEDACSSNGNKKEKLDQAFEVDPPHRLQEIMDLEQALQESQDQTLTNLSLSSRLSLQRLQAEYPEVDAVALKEEFARSGFSYKDTAEILCSRYRTEQGIPKTVIAPEAFYRYEQQLIRQAQQNSLAQQEQEELLALQESEEIVPDDPQVYRDEAHLHYRQRQEAFKKAQEASSQGMKAVAAYYARIGNEHSIKLSEANHRASKKILEATNANVKDANCLDLHHLHVTEALSAAQAFLIERRRVITARGLKRLKVSLITGRGVHSLGGQARLKPTIKEFLRKSGYIFHESNRGMFTVTLQG